MVPIDDDAYRQVVTYLRESSPVIQESLLGLVGQTSSGKIIFIPGSYRKGYLDSLRPSGERPQYTVNLGIVGQLSDGTWVFPPSYDGGLVDGSNSLRFAVLAEGEKRLFEQNRTLQSQQDELRRQLDDARRKIDQLERHVNEPEESNSGKEKA
jgi:hypothetical protein